MKGACCPSTSHACATGCCTDPERSADAGTEAGTAQGRFSDYESVVAETHRASIEARKAERRRVVAQDSLWPYGLWGEVLWTLVALYENEKTDAANAQLLARANAYISARRAEQVGTATDQTDAATTWSFFTWPDYVRTLCLFRAGSTHFPGRLRPETEAAMKEALWWLVKEQSKVADASIDNLLVLLGTENHDLLRRPTYYLVAAVLKDDPAFRDRRYDDGHTAAEHFAAYNAFFREWARRRVMSGLWIEVGSNTYQKYSWPNLFNLHELSPDPVVRKQFGMLLDLGFIEEEQIAVSGHRQDSHWFPV